MAERTGHTPAAKRRSGANAILITIGEHRLEGVLNSGPEAQQFLEMLPLGISMVQYGGREYYGGMEQRIDTEEQGRLFFDNGDITYCPENNSIAIFYAQTDRPNLTMHVIPMGKVTSDLSLFVLCNSGKISPSASKSSPAARPGSRTNVCASFPHDGKIRAERR